LALIVAVASPVAAQQFDLQEMRPGPSQQSNYFGVNSAEILGAGEWEVGMMLHFADDLLVVRERGDNERLAEIVDSQLVTNLMGAFGIADMLEIGIDIPIILRQVGDTIEDIPGADGEQGGAGIGSIRIVPVLNLYNGNQDERGGARISLSGDLMLPTGRNEDWQGESFRGEPEIAVDYQLANGIQFTGTLGYLIRKQTVLDNLQVEDTLTYGVGADFPLLNDDALHIVAELDGGAVLMGDERGDVEERPLEGRAGAKYFFMDGLMAEGGFGLGLVNGVGTPDWRIFAGLSYAGASNSDRDGDGLPNARDGCPNSAEDLDGYRDDDGCPEADNDDDGILDTQDDCPLDREDRDNWEDEDGCPDYDNDLDGILDASDQCPDVAEDSDMFEDLDGCIDPDNDEDGILDIDDQCPNTPEDFDGWDDVDGCADPDNDRDGRTDDEDECMNDPEDFDGFEDDDGCPEEGSGLVNLTCDTIEVGDRVHFDTNSDAIQSRSHELLDQVAGVMVSATYIHLVLIEGHTDDRGADDYNLGLSQRRATSVRLYLIERGVEEARLESLGFGEASPIAENSTVDGRAENRRVEFRILEQDIQCTD
jgi:outer membrane protein OmpA-like peptidoglycan-associated protein